MSEKIIVIGGTGMLGQFVVRQLAADGYNVRVLARMPDKAVKLFGNTVEVCAGDLADAAAVQSAMQGVTRVHVSIKGGPTQADFDRIEVRGTQTIATAARHTGVQHITYLSAYSILPELADSMETRAKVKAEQAIKDSGVPYTFFRPTWFMETLPLFVQGKRASLIGKQVHPLHWVAASDYSRMVSQSYRTPAALNKACYIYGPEALTMRQALEMYVRSAAPESAISVMPVSLFSLLGRLTRNAEWVSLADLMKHTEHTPEHSSPTEANQLLGAPSTTLPQWLAQRKTAS
jgi:uncharacterized protein YbjT (DUF2867 family)